MRDPYYIWTGPGGLDLPSGRPFWTTADMTPPFFERKQIAPVFYGRTVNWFRKVRVDHPHFWDEEHAGVIVVRQTAKVANPRQYSLHNIERLTMSMAAERVIDGNRAARALSILLLVARQYGHGPELDQVAREAAYERAER